MATLTQYKHAAIPTLYNGVQFRSRLEARWAAFFDLMQWPWEYEPFDLSGYIPDFYLDFEIPFIIEVKPFEKVKDNFGQWSDELFEVKHKIDSSGVFGAYAILGSVLRQMHGGKETGIIGVYSTKDSSSFAEQILCVCDRGCGFSLGITCKNDYSHLVHSVPITALAADWKMAGNMVQWRAR